MRLTTRGKVVVALACVGLMVVGWTLLPHNSGAGEPAAKPTPSQSPTPAPSTPTVATTPVERTVPTLGGVDLTAHSHTAADSIWVVVNKKHPLDPLTYAPDLGSVDGTDVAAVTASHLEDLLDAARADGVPLRIVSGYRSYGYQQGVYGRKKANAGQAEADRWSARPGHSEHQTGLAVDLADAQTSSCELQACFAGTEAATWIAEHAAEFGYIVRYTDANEASTGYNAEPWHIRYVGPELAQAMQATHTASLEDVFGVTGGDYEQ